VVVLIGCAGFVASCFVRSSQVIASPFTSLYQGFTAVSGARAAGGVLILFAGVAIAAVVAVVGLVRKGAAPWAPIALVVAVGGWSLTWAGLLLQFAWGTRGMKPGSGYALLSLLVAVVGTVVVAASSGRHPRSDPGELSRTSG
jgi:hypothetical protein